MSRLRQAARFVWSVLDHAGRGHTIWALGGSAVVSAVAGWLLFFLGMPLPLLILLIIGFFLIAMAALGLLLSKYFPSLTRSLPSQPPGSDQEDARRRYLTWVHQRLHQNEVISLPYMAAEVVKIPSKTFVDCLLLGPALVYFDGNAFMTDCIFSSSHGGDLFSEGKHGAPVPSGAIIFDDVVFRECRFDRVTFLGTDEQIKEWRTNIKVPSSVTLSEIEGKNREDSESQSDGL